jgi:5,10-methylenetetrahydrofolate reductase
MVSRRYDAMRYPVLSVEWGTFAANRSNLPRVLTHCVLPDLDKEVIPTSLRNSFYDIVPTTCQIQSVAVNNRSTNAWLGHVSARLKASKKKSSDSDDDAAAAAAAADPSHLLVVGGNHKKNGVDGTSLTTAAAIRACINCFDDRVIVWAVADLNAPDSINDAMRKLEAGATGIITQPLLSRRGFDSLMRYSEIMMNDASLNVTTVAGMALPKALRGLLFWESLLQSRLDGDPMFQDHCKYFQTKGNDCQWALAQMEALAPFDMIKGIHFMPMKNSRTLEILLNRIDKEQHSKQQ